MLIGLLLGIVIGLVLGPLLRSWLTWRQYVEASREARLHEDALRLMVQARSDDRTGESQRPIRSR
jgi:uncharacterized protein YneF (UPF0154 family)